MRSGWVGWAETWKMCGGEISKEKNLDKYEKKVKQVGGKKRRRINVLEMELA